MNQNRTIGSHLYIVDEINSTNSELLMNAGDYQHGTVLCARRQTAGRGRHQRDWRSQKGGLYFSILLKDQKKLTDVYPFILLTALSVVRCIQSCATRGVAIKWPNDIYINHRKVCGILTESTTMGDQAIVVIGIGINVNNPASRLKNLRNPAVSLKECRAEKVDLDDLLNRILFELDILYSDLLAGNFIKHLPELNRLLYSKDREIELLARDGLRMIKPIAFTEEAKLLCEEGGVKKEILFGEM